MLLLSLIGLGIAVLIVMAKGKMSKVAAKAVKAGSNKMKVTSVATNLSLERVLQEAEQFPMMRGGWRMVDGMRHLLNVDPKFAELISQHGIPEAFKRDTSDSKSTVVPLPVPTGGAEEHYFSLLKIIIYQQLSAKSAEPILNRFISTFGASSKFDLTPELVSSAKFETTFIDGNKKILLNGAVSGLSEGKAKYIRDLTEHYLDPTKLQGVDLSAITDEELRTKLLAVKGLGQWSVDMFMLFDLQRSNVLPMGDLVVRKGVARFHGLSEKYFDSKKNLEQAPEICRAWAPYSSLATCYMWKVKDQVPAENKAQPNARGRKSQKA
jgi:DNA-3-methyladenine glycosylase II